MVLLEVWRTVTIKPFDSIYEVSNKGRVRRRVTKWVGDSTYSTDDQGNILKTSRKKIKISSEYKFLSASTNTHGYLFVSLKLGKEHKQPTVHNLVALAFLGPPPSKNTSKKRTSAVRHKDGDKLNNWATNLVWGTYKSNEADKILHGSKPLGRAGRSKLTLREVVRIRKARGSEYYPKAGSGRTLKEMGSKFSVSLGQISKICKFKGFDPVMWLDMLEQMDRRKYPDRYSRLYSEAKLLLSAIDLHPKKALVLTRLKSLPKPINL